VSAEFIAHCPDCGHSWTVAFLPLTIDKFAKLAKAARCPTGCDAGPLCGHAPAAKTASSTSAPVLDGADRGAR
jgi:hypothetical protein